jgi:CMP/dCMP kinase
MRSSFQIAIDGPVAAGKGTVSRLLAQKLGFLYVDTGAMYRATALLAIRAGVKFSDEDLVVSLLEKAKLEMRNPQPPKETDGRLTTVILDGEDVSWAIRTQKCSEGASKVAVLAKLRRVLVQKQQEIAAKQNVVMEGRDITFRVLPEAQVKIFLTASVESRAERRHTQYLTKGTNVSLEEVIEEIKERDERDTKRDADPLHIADDAWVLDTSNLSIEEVVDLIEAKVNKMQSQDKQNEQKLPKRS